MVRYTNHVIKIFVHIDENYIKLKTKENKSIRLYLQKGLNNKKIDNFRTKQCCHRAFPIL